LRDWLFPAPDRSSLCPAVLALFYGLACSLPQAAYPITTHENMLLG
jgi:hypothetical protein